MSNKKRVDLAAVVSGQQAEYRKLAIEYRQLLDKHQKLLGLHSTCKQTISELEEDCTWAHGRMREYRTQLGLPNGRTRRIREEPADAAPEA